MVGQVLGAVGSLPEIFTELEISFFLLRRLLGVRMEGDKKQAKVRLFYIKHMFHYYFLCVKSGYTYSFGKNVQANASEFLENLKNISCSRI